MGKKKGSKAKKGQLKKADPLRYEARFADLISRCESDDTIALLKGLAIIAQELNELNVAASELMSLPELLGEINHHLESLRDGE